MCWDAISAVGTVVGSVAAGVAALLAYRALDWFKQNQMSHKYQSYVSCLIALNELEEEIEELEKKVRAIVMLEDTLDDPESKGEASYERTIIRDACEQARKTFLKQSALAMRFSVHLDIAISDLNAELKRRRTAISRDSGSGSQPPLRPNDYSEKLQAVRKWLDHELGIDNAESFKK